MNDDLRNVVAQGQKQSLEFLALQNKQLTGTLTPEETTRLAMLTGSLTQLANQALGLAGYTPEQAQEVLEQGGLIQPRSTSTETEDEDYDDYDDDDFDDDDYDDLLDLDDDDEEDDNF